MVRLRAIVLMFVLLLAGTLSASAQQLPQLYVANEWQESLELVNLNTSQITNPLYYIGAKPDDLTLNSAGQLIYSLPTAGKVNLYDPTTGMNQTLVSGIPGALDLAIEPGGQTMLIAKHSSPAEIFRFNFATGTTTVLVSKVANLGTCDGIAYDVYGNLYAVANHNTIVQINPTTGAILATLVLEPHNGINGGDGLTYDSYTNSLWATHDGKTLGGGLIQIPVLPSGFTSFTFFSTPTMSAPDGIKSDGAGNLYIGAIHTVVVYNIPTHTIIKNIVVNGGDGVSLVPGTY